MDVRIIQVRNADDPMLEHELDCITRRCQLARGPVKLNSPMLLPTTPEHWLDGQSAVIIGGSGAYSVYSPEIQHQVARLSSLIQACATRRVPLFGVCFGHQLIAESFGGSVKPDPQASEMGTVEMSLAPGGEKDPIFQGLPKSFEVQSGHSDSIVRPPEGAVALHNNVRVPKRSDE